MTTHTNLYVDHSSRKRTKHGKKNVKSHDFLDFEKNVKNVEVITYMPIVLKTMVTTLNQLCCLSHNSKAIIF